MEEVDVQQRFEDFFKAEEYRERLAQLGLEGRSSIRLNFERLVQFDSGLAEALMEHPDEFLQHISNGAFSQLQIEDPEYAEKVKGLKVRVYNLFEATPLRSIGAEHIAKLVMVKGVVVKATDVKPRVVNVAFECKRCGTRMFVEQTTSSLTTPFRCSNPTCGRKGPFEMVKEECEYVNFQKIWLQERPEELPPGQLPQSLRVRVIGDLVNVARPGDDVSVVGIVRVQPQVFGNVKLTTFDIYLEANSIEALGKEPEAVPTAEEVRLIEELAKDPWIHRKVMVSIAPSIYGYEDVKEAIMYLLFGAVGKTLQDIKIRGELNVLLIGDPSTGKTQLLRCVAKVAPRGLYTSGRGTTAAGLTAAVLREKGFGSYSLQAGALVLADKGVAAIDEIDKMRPEDRVAIHEALEQHTVSVAKGGIVATLNARTAVLAAANPLLGRYEPNRGIAANFSLPVTLLSRFDLIFLMLDVPNLERDAKIVNHILNLHRGVVPQPPIEASLLRKYIAYARGVKPVLTKEAKERLDEFYKKMREVSAKSEETPIAISWRQLEALVRIAEARARVALRREVVVEDAEAAIRVMAKSMEQVGIDVTTGRVDVDLIMTGKPKSLRDRVGVLLDVLIEMERETGMVAKEDLLDELEHKYGIERKQGERVIQDLTKAGSLYSPRDGYVKKA